MYDEIVVLILTVTVLIILIIIWIIITLYNNNICYIMDWWNTHIRDECDKQDIGSINGIPTLHYAMDCPNKSIQQLHQLITTYHNDIEKEIDMRITSDTYIKKRKKWEDVASNLPTLTRITSLFNDIIDIYVMILDPGMTMIEEKGLSKAIYHYQYSLKVPEKDDNFKIAGHEIIWEKRQGLAWDETVPYSMWNHTKERRILIIAKVLRELTTINRFGTNLLYSM